jgi:cobalamin biosynthesis protein CobD/CbiB
MTGGTLGRTATVRAAGLALGMLADALPVVLAGSAMQRAARACLCARDATGLDTDDLARATVESMAGNTSDAVGVTAGCLVVSGGLVLGWARR